MRLVATAARGRGRSTFGERAFQGALAIATATAAADRLAAHRKCDRMGLECAKPEGKALGRPSSLSEKQKRNVRADLAKGMSVSAVARKFATSRQTIMRVRKEGYRA